MTKFQQLVARGNQLRAADNRSLVEKITAVAEATRNATILAAAAVEDQAVRAGKDYMAIRRALKAQRVADYNVM